MLHAVGEDRQDSGSENMLAEDLVRKFLLRTDSVFFLLFVFFTSSLETD